MVNHGHFLLNGEKHNIPSSFLKVGDKLEVKEKLKTSPLFSQNLSEIKNKVPSWIKVDKNASAIEILGLPKM
jgi:small subunit ribosomal protein S4